MHNCGIICSGDAGMVAEASRPLERREVEQLVREVLRERLRSRHLPSPAIERSATTRTAGPPHPLAVNVSPPHMHVTPPDVEVLFGPAAKLTNSKDLYQEDE